MNIGEGWAQEERGLGGFEIVGCVGRRGAGGGTVI